MSLSKIQTTLKAPKGQFNSFGKYKYRSCEDILEAIKPHLEEFKYSLVIADDMVRVGDSNYIKATVTLYDESGAVIANASAFAREAVNKKGMDDSQITGTTSSYARKYALNGLFAIDDNKDADTDQYVEKVEKQPRKTNKQLAGEFKGLMDTAGSFEDLKTQFGHAYNWADKTIKDKAITSDIKNHYDKLKSTFESSTAA